MTHFYQKMSWGNSVENFIRDDFPHTVITGVTGIQQLVLVPDASRIMAQVTRGYVTFVLGSPTETPDPSDVVGFRLDEDSGIVFIEFVHEPEAKFFIEKASTVLQIQWGK